MGQQRLFLGGGGNSLRIVAESQTVLVLYNFKELFIIRFLLLGELLTVKEGC